MPARLNDPKIAIPIILVAIGLSAYFIFVPEEDPTHVPHLHYYYDLNTGEEFVVESETVPPIEAPSGKPYNGKPAGVQVMYYSCGKCTKEERFIGFLSTFNDEQRAIALKGGLGMRSIRLPEDEDGEWVLIESPEGRELYKKVMAKCPPGKRIIVCTPR
jgi:hypothetical protein